MKPCRFVQVLTRLLLMSIIILPLFASFNIISPSVNAQTQGTDHPWPMFLQNPQHTGYSDGPAPRQPAILWTYTFGNYLSFSVAASYGKVFAACQDNQIYALNETSGQKIWNYTLPYSIFSSPAVSDGNVFASSADHNIYALDQSTGSKIWNFTVGPLMPAPTVADDMVFVSSTIDPQEVYALNQTTGSKIWNFTTDSLILSSIAVSVDSVFVEDFVNLYALNKLTGAKIWNYSIAGPFALFSPVVANNRVFVVNGTNQLFAIDQSTGNKVWNFTTDGQILASPAIAYNKIFLNSQVNTNLTKVYALDLNGTKIWQSQTSAASGFSSPAVADGMAFVASANATYAKVDTFNQSDGSKVWEYDSGLYYRFTSPIVSDGKLIVTFNSTLTAFGIHDLTMAALAVPSSVNLGDQVRINVTAHNTGDFTESSNVAVYVNGTSIGTQPISNLAPDATATFTFTWNTSGIQTGNYNVTATIQTVSLERDTTDNTQMSWVTVSAPAEFPLMLVIGIVVAVVVIAAVIIYLKRRPKKPKPPRLKLSANPAEILADGKSTSTIRAELVDEKGAAALAKEDTTVSLTSTGGRMAGSVTIPKGQSSATATLTSSTNIGSVALTATSKGLKDTKSAVTFKEKKRYCMHCGEVMAYTARVCSKCGRTPPAGVDTKVCRNCSSVIPTVAKFCSECGASQPESAP